MLINCGEGRDPWSAARRLNETPEIDPTSMVRASDFGCYTFLGPQSSVVESRFGDYSYAMGRNQIIHADIGKFCNIATDVRINPSNHPLWRATLHHFTYRSRSYGFSLDDDEGLFQWRREDRVVIGADVWIGHGATILPGVTIGLGAAIGSASVVTKDVPPFAVIVGNPGKILRYRVDAKTAEALQRIAWWDWSHPQLDAALADFRDLDAQAFAEKYDR